MIEPTSCPDSRPEPNDVNENVVFSSKISISGLRVLVFERGDFPEGVR
jgi:hypothetical protein